MTSQTMRATILPGKPFGTTLRLPKLLAVACICLFFTASHAPAQPAAGGAAPGAQSGRGAWKVHAMRGNRPLYRRGGEILVQYQKGANRAVLNTPALAALIQGTRASRGDIEAVIFDEATIEFAALRDQLLATAGVLRAEPNILFSTQSSTNQFSGIDYSDKQWQLTSTRGHSRLMQRSRTPLPKGKAVRVGVIDTGVDYGHLEFAGRTLPGVNLISHPMPGEDPGSELDFNGHGTRVAGIIAAADDGAGVLGINPRAAICSVKTFNRDGDGYLEDIIAGIDWAVGNRMQLINMSFGTYGYSELFQEAITRAREAGILLVAAAGNDAAEMAMFPAAFEGVLSVGAHDEGGWTSLFSNWGPEVDFHAPGTRTLTTDLWHDGYHPYTVFHGTSAAAAYTTGVASLLIENGDSAASAADLLRENVISRSSDFQVRSQPDLGLNGRLVMARLLGEQYSELTIVSFRTDRSIFSHEDGFALTYAIQNTGTLPSAPTPAWLAVREGETTRRVALSSVPRLSPGERYEAGRVIPVSQLLDQTGGSDTNPHRLGVELALDTLPLAKHAHRPLLITEKSVGGVRIGALWVSPLDFNDANTERTLYATVQNTGRERQSGLVARVYAVAAVHEGVAQVPKIDLGTIPIGSLMPGEISRLSIPLRNFEPPAERVTFWMEIEQNGRARTRYLQGYIYARSGDTAKPQYAELLHRVIADEAIKLLEAQGIILPDLDPNGPYRGNVAPVNNWPLDVTGLPTAAWSDPDYWTDADLADLAAYYGLGNFTMVDGSWDADFLDIAFGYEFEDNFDSHFWIVDNNDDDGLNSGTINHHSALSKLRALLFGRDAVKGFPADNQLAYGAVDHYLAGHKQAAWWFLGHAVHLIGDLSVPSHVDNENSHGVYGATYHRWMDHGGYNFWDFNDALSQGGFVYPYDPANAGDPLRYLAYTTAQMGNAFPWASTLLGTTYGSAGNRTAGGDLPHYDATMASLFASLEPHPIALWHVQKDEVRDWCLGQCQAVDFVGPCEDRADCFTEPWGFHIDYDNTDGDGNDSDGDMTRIGSRNYPYAIRAAAGLIYHFAVQTGQIPSTVLNLNDAGSGSLRQKIAEAVPGSWIRFHPALYAQTIALTTGQVLINKDLNIDASNLPYLIKITGNNSTRVFEIAGGANVTLKGLTLSGGSATAAAPGDRGGAILNRGTLTVSNSTFSDNTASVGAAVFNTIADGGGTFTLVNSTVSGNNASFNGGALLNELGTVTVVHSTLAGNAAGFFGGGIDNAGGTLKIENTIVAGNSAPSGPDIGNRDGGTVTPVAANLVGNNDTVAAGFPADGILVGGGTLPAVNPLLNTLGPNGAPPWTRSPVPGSPALNRATAGAWSLTADQRGQWRPGFPYDDLGSIELPECGNGVLVASEGCDDSNPVGGDCCSQLCGFEGLGSACNLDASVCTMDTCNGTGTCGAGGPLACVDGNVCTNDACHPVSGCMFTSNTAPCDDGDACTTADVCGGGICLGGPPLVPGPSEDLTLTGGQVAWPPLPRAATYDVVRGNLGLLGGSGGNFSVATTACLANDYSMTTLDDTAFPAPGSGFFYLMRGANCAGAGTYDSPGSGQSTSRDPGIAAAPITCSWCVSDAANAAGNWSGVVDQFDNGTLVYQFNVLPSITTCTGLGGVIGTVDYPEFGCGGNWVLLSRSGSTLTVEERLTYGLAACVDLCRIDLNYDAGTGTLDYHVPLGGCAGYPTTYLDGTLVSVP